jgi:hypothetical protein
MRLCISGSAIAASGILGYSTDIDRDRSSGEKAITLNTISQRRLAKGDQRILDSDAKPVGSRFCSAAMPVTVDPKTTRMTRNISTSGFLMTFTYPNVLTKMRSVLFD